MEKKKMTIKYWNTLSEDSKYRALCFVFGPNKFSAEMYSKEKPNLKDGMWQLIFRKIRQTDGGYYKTCVGNCYIP